MSGATIRRRWERSRPYRRSVALLATLTMVVTGMLVALPPAVEAATPTATAVEFVNISATSSLSFVPDTFTVLPGATVHLTVTQLADFDHTFTLSPSVNVTISSVSFFSTHTPIVNLSLGPTPGEKYTATFVAPSTLGTYEYVCEIHFPTMTGVMTVANAPPSAGGSSFPTTAEWIGIGAAIGVIVVVAGVVAWNRSRRRSHSGGAAPPVKKT